MYYELLMVMMRCSEIRNYQCLMCSFLQWPGKKASTPSGWAIPAQISVYLWLGLLQDKKHYIDTLPKGYELSSELKNADKLRSNAPPNIFYGEKHVRFKRSLF